jgi:uncharacterized repeat protein (TIGR03803 family)
MRLTVCLLCCSVLVACARWGTSSPLPAGQSYGTSIPCTNSGYKTIYSFKFNSATSGDFPQGPLTNVKGTLYGTTQGGGTHDDGTVFKLTPAVDQKIIYSFKAGSDGANPIRSSR